MVRKLCTYMAAKSVDHSYPGYVCSSCYGYTQTFSLYCIKISSTEITFSFWNTEI